MRGPDSFQLPTARKLRRNETFAEKRLWEQLRDRRLGGKKFVRQAPVGPFVVDFLCRENGLIIEIDGATHSTDAELDRDQRRSAFLQRGGYRIIRFQNDEVVNGMDQVLARLEEVLAKTSSLPR